MKIAVVMRQVPDLIEPLEVAESGTELDLEEAAFVPNEYDDHALEQALLLKEAAGAEVAVVALDAGEVDNTLYAAAAKGADRIIKLEPAGQLPRWPDVAADLYVEAIRSLQPDVVLVGCQAHDELAGNLAPLLAARLQMPYVGVIRGVKADDGRLVVFKEYPAAAMARICVGLPAVLGILAASQPPRYVPVSRIRAAMKSAQFEQAAAPAPTNSSACHVRKLYAPQVTSRAEMLDGSEEEIAAKLLDIFTEKGLVQ